LSVHPSFHLQRAAVDFVLVAKRLQRQVGANPIERAKVDALVDTEEVEADRGLTRSRSGRGRYAPGAPRAV
jgi:hypothetical protein